MQTTIGACIRKRDDGSYMMSEIIGEIATPRIGKRTRTPKEGEVEQSLDWIKENAKIDLIQQYRDVQTEDARFAAMASSASDGTASMGTSYSSTDQTGELNIVNHVPSTAYSNWWSAKPISPEKNASYTISPSMMVEVSNGTTTTAEAKATFSYLNLQKSFIAGWVAGQDKVVTIKVS